MEDDGAEAEAAGDERDGHQRPAPQRADELDVLRVVTEGLQVRVGDLGAEVGLAGAHRHGRGDDEVDHRRVAIAQLPQERLLRGIRVRGRDALQAVVAIEHVDDAPVGEEGHGEAGDPGERRVVVERFGQERAGLGEETDRLLGPGALADLHPEPLEEQAVLDGDGDPRGEEVEHARAVGVNARVARSFSR